MKKSDTEKLKDRFFEECCVIPFKISKSQDDMWKWIESNCLQKQEAARIKEVEHLKENLQLGVNTRMKYEELKIAGDKMAEALNGVAVGQIIDNDQYFDIIQVLSEWEKLNKL